jgi:hypothetical protein
LEGDERVKGGCAGDIDQDWKLERRMDLMLSVSATSEAEQATYV